MRWEGGGFWLAGWVVLELFVGRCVFICCNLFRGEDNRKVCRQVGGAASSKQKPKKG
jgi:hypothetical protein